MSDQMQKYARALKSNFDKIDTDRSGSFSEDELTKFAADKSHDRLALEAVELLKYRYFEATLLADSREERLSKESFTNKPLAENIIRDSYILPGITNPHSRAYYSKTFGEDKSLPSQEITRRDIEVLDEVTQPKNYYDRQAQFRKGEIAWGLVSGVVGYPVAAAIAATGAVATIGAGISSGFGAPVAAAVLGTATYAGTWIVGQATYRRTRGLVNSEAEAIGSEWQWRQDLVENWIKNPDGFRQIR